jgi:hypothetical protein
MKNRNSELAKLRVAEHRRKIKERAVKYKGGVCQECGYDKCIAALDFHHKNPSKKDFRISTGRSFGWEKTKEELDKCVLLCSNCHREIHHEERQIELNKIRQKLKEFARPDKIKVECKQCKKKLSVPPFKLKRCKNIFCTDTCRRKFDSRVDWDSIDLHKMIAEGLSKRKIAQMLGVSDKTVTKHLMKPWQQRLRLHP